MGRPRPVLVRQQPPADDVLRVLVVEQLLLRHADAVRAPRRDAAKLRPRTALKSNRELAHDVARLVDRDAAAGGELSIRHWVFNATQFCQGTGLKGAEARPSPPGLRILR